MKTLFLLFFFSFTLLASPLHEAVTDINEKKVHALVEKGVDVNALNNKGQTALHLAAPIGRYSLVKYLVEHGADVHIKDKFHKTPLVYAIEKNQIKVVMYLSKRANKSEAKYEINGLFESAERGDINALAYFLEKYDINLKNEDGKTALHIACEAGQYEVVSFLLDSGADKNILDDDGRDALNYAKLSRNKKIILLLMENNATH